MKGSLAVSAEGYPVFSDREMRRRRSELLAVLDQHDVRHVLLYGTGRNGSAVQWLTGWPATAEALAVVTPGEQDVLIIQFHNHVPNARRLAGQAIVRSGDPSTLAVALDVLASRDTGRVGIIGPLPASMYRRLAPAVQELVFLDQSYTWLRLKKSDEEIGWARIGASLTDQAVRALASQAETGMTEAELCAIIEGAYLGTGATNHIHYIGVTPMREPVLCVPAQWPSSRRLAVGDVLICEVSASYWGYSGQLLRTFTVGADPTPLYQDLHDVAKATFDEIVAMLRPGVSASMLATAGRRIEDAGYQVYDSMVHGFVGGMLPPHISGPAHDRASVASARADGSGDADTAEDFTLEPGMLVVVQPNVITPDARAGVQTGQLMLIDETGCSSLHRFPEGLHRIG